MAYEEYPRHLHKAGGVHTVVHNDEEKAAALEAGYALAPVLDEAAADGEPADAKPAAPEIVKKSRKPKADPRA